MPLSAEEQLAFEIINRARLDPLREMQRLGLDLNAGLDPGTLTASAKQVLAPNALLENAAQGHGEWMLQTGVFSHTGQGGSAAGDRMEQSGYAFTGAWGRGENLAYYRTGGGPLDMAVVMPAHLDGLFQSASHRKNLLKDDYRELGMAEVNGVTPTQPRPTSYLVQNFAYSGTASFLTGVVYQDRDGDRFYDIGEGRADTRITLGGVSALSAAAGGYALGGIDGTGYQRVTVAGAGQPLVFALEFRGLNVKLDIVDGSTIHVSSSARLQDGVTEARLLGIEALQLTGGAGNEALHGNAAGNLLQGGAGNDVIWGYGGNDTLRGDAGNDTLYGGAGDDNLAGGAGNDLIWGESGANVIWAGAGNDTIYGGAGRNRLLGNDPDWSIWWPRSSAMTSRASAMASSEGAGGLSRAVVFPGELFPGAGALEGVEHHIAQGGRGAETAWGPRSTSQAIAAWWGRRSCAGWRRGGRGGAALTLLTRSHAELDLTDQRAVRAFLQAERPDLVILAAARVGGILANNTYPADFIYENLMIQSNVIHQSHAAGVRLQLGSSCIYPRAAAQPMAEEALLTGPLEPTNEPYAVAKIAGIKLCESYNRQHGTDYRSVMPTNLYGPGDNFHPETSHVLPALLRRFHEAARTGAPEVVIWGTGRPRREFLHVDDMAAAALFLLDLPQPAYAAATLPMQSHLNIGTGQDVSILELAGMVARVTGFGGRIRTDPDKPDGAPRKLLEVGRLADLGWRAAIGLEEGLAETYAWFTVAPEWRG